VSGGKKSGTETLSKSWYFKALATSYFPYFALAGSVQGGLLPARSGLVVRNTERVARTNRCLHSHLRGILDGIYDMLGF
jgi:hypothetical protein